MPTITTPALREAFVNIVVSSPRPEGVPATIIPSAAKHDEIASVIEAALDEYQHLSENEGWVASAKQIGTYLPASGAAIKYYAVRSLMPAGSIVEVNEDFFLDILRIRFSLMFAVLPPSLMADPRTGKAFPFHWQKAFKDLLVTGWSLENVFIPGDEDRRPGDRTEIDITLEMGGYQGRLRHEQAPSA
jgi:hypothetical protein